MEGCDGGEIDINHLLLHCRYAQNVRSLVFSLFRIHWVIPKSDLDTLCTWAVMFQFLNKNFILKKYIELWSKLRMRYCFCFLCDLDWHSLTLLSLFNENGFLIWRFELRKWIGVNLFISMSLLWGWILLLVLANKKWLFYLEVV